MNLLSFSISDIHFAIPHASVERIVESNSIVRLPIVPSFISGMINFRGRVITVVDIAELFRLDDIQSTIEYILISKTAGDIGYLVRDIKGVLVTDENNFEDAGRFDIEAPRREYVTRITRNNAGDLIGVVDTNVIEADMKNLEKWRQYEKDSAHC